MLPNTTTSTQDKHNVGGKAFPWLILRSLHQKCDADLLKGNVPSSKADSHPFCLAVYPCASKHAAMRNRTRTHNLTRNGICASLVKNNCDVVSPEAKLTAACLLLVTYGLNPTSTGLGTGQRLQAGHAPVPANLSSHSFPHRDLRTWPNKQWDCWNTYIINT